MTNTTNTGAAVLSDERIDWIANAACSGGLAHPNQVKNAIRLALRDVYAASSEPPQICTVLCENCADKGISLQFCPRKPINSVASPAPVTASQPVETVAYRIEMKPGDYSFQSAKHWSFNKSHYAGYRVHELNLGRMIQNPGVDIEVAAAFQSIWSGVRPDTATPTEAPVSQHEYSLDEYEAGQWWLQSLEKYHNGADPDLDTKRAAKVACDFAALVFASRVTAPASGGEALPVEVQNVAHELAAGSGFWHSCSGCYETEDGRPVGHYAYSEALRCALGSGCQECGGLGAIWDNTDYSEEAYNAILATKSGSVTAPAAEVVPLPEGWQATHMPPWSALTPEANAEKRIYVERVAPPYCDKQSMRVWHGPTLAAALKKAHEALGLSIPATEPVKAEQQDDAGHFLLVEHHDGSKSYVQCRPEVEGAIRLHAAPVKAEAAQAGSVEWTYQKAVLDVLEYMKGFPDARCAPEVKAICREALTTARAATQPASGGVTEDTARLAALEEAAEACENLVEKIGDFAVYDQRDLYDTERERLQTAADCANAIRALAARAALNQGNAS